VKTNRRTPNSTAKVPPRTLPLLYVGTAHVALALAFGLAAWWPRAVAGFFYHSWMAALVHLVTLGWITFSVFGSFYIVGPLALRMEMRPRRMDYVAYTLGVVGLVGMVAHFWIEEYSGMAWSAATITAGALYMTARIAAGVRRAPVSIAVRLHIILACVSLWLAATMGVLIAIHKAVPFLPGFVLSNVFAHAHLAAIGWATMMVVGVGYRLLPIVLPSKMPTGPSMYASAMLLVQSPWSLLFGVLIAAGLVVFLGHIVWMVRHPAAKPPAAPEFDFAVAHAACAGACLIATVVLGLVLLTTPMSTNFLRAAAAYGVMGLVGFLAQMVVAMETRLLPMVAWCWAYARSGHTLPPPSPYRMRKRTLQALVLAAWGIGIPALASGMAFESWLLVASGATSLFIGVAVAAIDLIYMPTGTSDADGFRSAAA
jgi:hypothetical protein